VAGEVDREQDGDQAGRQDDQLKRTGVHQDRRPPPWADDRVPTRRVACAARVRTTGEHLPGSPHAFRGGTLQAVAECSKGREGGSNSLGGPVYAAPTGHRRGGGTAPILRDL